MVKVNGQDVEWKDAPKGHYISDVKFKVLFEDDATGAQMVLIKVPVSDGFDRPHTHLEANQWSFVLSGEWESPDGTRHSASEGNYRSGYQTKGQIHGPQTKGYPKIIKDVYMLHYWDGPLTKEFP